MAKNNRPEIDNPIAGMGLDEIVRGITSPVKKEVSDKYTDGAIDTVKELKARRRSKKTLEENLEKYTGINEQGVAIWLPKEVKKKLELIRINASRNIPLRSLAAAIIMTYIEENEDKISKL